MNLLVRAFPVLEGKADKLAEFARALETDRAAEAQDFYRRRGVHRETWHTQVTPHGLWVIGVAELPDKPLAVLADEYAASAAPFDKWFKEQVLELTGIDPNVTPLGPPTQCIYDSHASRNGADGGNREK